MITGDGYALRPVEFNDLIRLRAHRNRPDTRCFLGSDREISADEQISWWERGGAESFRIAIRTSDATPVGLVRLTDLQGESACVGADVFAQHRGHGLGHVVFRLACDYAQLHGASDLWLRVFLQNTAAVKIYLSAGFRFTADQRIDEVVRHLPGRGGPSLVHYAHMERKNRT